MSNFLVTSALAAPFTIALTTFTVTLNGTVYTASVAAGTYRIALAPAAADILRVVAAALAAVPGLPGGITFAAALNLDGRVEVESNYAFFKLTSLHTTLLGHVLGFDAASPVESYRHTATRGAWYLGLFAALHGGVWTPRRSGALERDAGGRVYSFAGALTSYDRELRADLIPWSPVEATEADSTASPMWPLVEYRGSEGATATARVWGLVDLWTAAQNGLCALAVGNLATVLASTAERYDLGYLASSLLEPERQDPRWSRYVSAQFTVVLPVSGSSGTRA